MLPLCKYNVATNILLLVPRTASQKVKYLVRVKIDGTLQYYKYKYKCRHTYFTHHIKSDDKYI
jgi:hypothetical protein